MKKSDVSSARPRNESQLSSVLKSLSTRYVTDYQVGDEGCIWNLDLLIGGHPRPETLILKQGPFLEQ